MKNVFPILLASLLVTSCSLLPKKEPTADTPEESTETVEITETTPTPTPTPDPTDPTTPAEKKPNPVVALWQRVFPPKDQAADTPAATAPNWIGTVKAVSDRDDYVLIDSQPYQGLPTGAILTSVGAESETGSVRVSDDRDPPFFIADIVSGKPAPGDRVYSPNP
jgi:hypothetical protein